MLLFILLNLDHVPEQTFLEKDVGEGMATFSSHLFCIIHLCITFHFHALEKEMAAHSSVLAWRIPGTGKPGGLLSVGSHRVGHD